MSTEAAESHLTRSMLEVWERVTGEMEMTGAQFVDHFMLAVATLPHKVRYSDAVIFISCANGLFKGVRSRRISKGDH